MAEKKEIKKETEESVKAEQPKEKDTASKAELKKAGKEIEKLKEENKTLTATLEEEKDKYLRILAEYDNFRRRTQKEKDNIYADAYNEALSEILPVLDNLERAKQYSESGNLEEGIGIIINQVQTAMDKLGITVFGEKGEPFNPEIHNAIMHVDDESLGENVIAEVFQRGYKKGDRIIRHAMVKVAN